MKILVSALFCIFLYLYFPIYGCLSIAMSQEVKNDLYGLELNGSKQWVLETTKSPGSPILLYIHGGPGSVLLPFSHKFDSELWENFTVVHWDQRLAGKSYRDSDKQHTISINTFVQDCITLVKSLKAKHHNSKIYLLGHSWGSIVGILAAKKLENLIDGYIGIGQLVNDVQGQKMGYEYILEKSKGTEEHTQILKLGVPPYSSPETRSKLSDYVMKYGGVFSKITVEELGEAFTSSPHYSKEDMQKQGIGFKASQELLGQKILEFDAREEAPKLEIPVWFIHGTTDYATPLVLLKDFYDKLNAPLGKKLIEMKNIGHFPFWDQPKIFSKLIERELL